MPGPTPRPSNCWAQDNDKAVSLFYRTLMHRRKSARPPVVAAIEQAMFRLQPLPQDGHAAFRRLNRLIDVLGDMQREDGGKDLQWLIETCLARIEQGLPEPPKVNPPRYWENDYRRTDVNRSLTWLLLQLGEEASRKQFGKALTSLGAKVHGGWKHEIQIAMNAIKLEDTQGCCRHAADAERPACPLAQRPAASGKAGIAWSVSATTANSWRPPDMGVKSASGILRIGRPRQSSNKKEASSRFSFRPTIASCTWRAAGRACKSTPASTVAAESKTRPTWDTTRESARWNCRPTAAAWSRRATTRIPCTSGTPRAAGSCGPFPWRWKNRDST